MAKRPKTLNGTVRLTDETTREFIARYVGKDGDGIFVYVASLPADHLEIVQVYLDVIPAKSKVEFQFKGHQETSDE